MPCLDDAALPPGVNTLRREIPIRLFFTLLYVEVLLQLDCVLTMTARRYLDYMAIRAKTSLPPPLG